jgi:hypothetical protein
MPSYDLIYQITTPYGFNADRISSTKDLYPCAICLQSCQWYNADLDAHLCSTECEINLFEQKLNSTPNEKFLITKPTAEDYYFC